MQTKAFTGISASQALTEATLGWDPNPYSYFYIQVLGSESETWQVKVKAPGSSSFAPIGGLFSSTIPIPGTVAITPDHAGNVGELEVTFSGALSGTVAILVCAMNRPGLGQR